MIGNYLSTLLVCVFAYLYPLFLCFKVKISFFIFFRKFFPLSFPGRRTQRASGRRDADFFFFFFFFSNKRRR